MGRRFYEDDVGSAWNPANWTKKGWAIFAGGAAVVIAVVVAVAVVVTKNKSSDSYPSYAAVNYTLVDTYSGSVFFENFNYFTGYDPGRFISDCSTAWHILTDQPMDLCTTSPRPRLLHW